MLEFYEFPIYETFFKKYYKITSSSDFKPFWTLKQIFRYGWPLHVLFVEIYSLFQQKLSQRIN